MPPPDPPAATRYAGDRRRDAKRALYEGRYDDSWAVLIGIDRYHNDIDGCHDDNYNPLRLAAADAVAMARALVKHRRFPLEKVFLLVESGKPLLPDPRNLQAWLDKTPLGDRYRRSA